MSPTGLDTGEGRIASGVPGLDLVLGGGLIRGSTYVVWGAPGSGKTVLANQLAFALASAGESTVYLAMMAETHTRLVSNLRSLTFFDEAQLGTRIRYISAAAPLEEGGLHGLAELLGNEVQASNASLLVIDSTASIEEIAESPHAYRIFLRRVATSSAMRGCTSLLIVPETGSGGRVEPFIADCVMELHQTQRGVRRIRELVVSKSRGSPSLSGRHCFKIDSAGAAVYPRFERVALGHELVRPVAAGRQRFGIPGLDGMFRGGLPTGSITALMGPPGSGKTLLGISLLAQGLREDQPALYFGTYETPPRLLLKTRAVGLDLQPWVSSGALLLHWEQPAEKLLDEMAERLLREVDQRGIRRLFIDGADGLMQASFHPERFAVFFAALCNELRARGVTGAVSVETAVDLPRAHTVPVALSASVENIVVTRYLQVRSQFHRLISILKVRDSDYDTSVRKFTISSGGLEVAESFESAESVLGELGRTPPLSSSPEPDPESGPSGGGSDG